MAPSTTKVVPLLVIALLFSQTAAFTHPRVLARAVTQQRAPSDVVPLYAVEEDEDDVFADIFKARDTRRAAIKEKAFGLAAALALEEKLVEVDDAEGRALDGKDEEEEINVEAAETVVEADEEEEDDDEEDEQYYTAAELFELLDLDGDGTLTKAEVVAGAMKLDITEEEAAALFDDLDANDDGELSQAELNLLTNENLDDDDNYKEDESSNSPDNVVALFDNLFKMADADNSGGIDLGEFRQLYSLLAVVSGGAAVDAGDVRLVEVFNSMDADGSGTVDIKELKEYIGGRAALEWPELYDEVSSWG